MSGAEPEGCEGVPEIAVPPHRLSARRVLGRPPLERAEVVDVEIAPSLARKQQRRAVAILDPVECVERASLEWDRSQARLCFRDLELAASEGTAHVDDPFLAVNVALLEGDPLRRPEPCCG